MPKQYKVKKCETLGDIARKLRLPPWKYLHQLNRDAIGDNPDLRQFSFQRKLGVIVMIKNAWQWQYDKRLCQSHIAAVFCTELTDF